MCMEGGALRYSYLKIAMQGSPSQVRSKSAASDHGVTIQSAPLHDSECDVFCRPVQKWHRVTEDIHVGLAVCSWMRLS